MWKNRRVGGIGYVNERWTTVSVVKALQSCFKDGNETQRERASLMEKQEVETVGVYIALQHSSQIVMVVRVATAF
jgi:hypothetical protein